MSEKKEAMVSLHVRVPDYLKDAIDKEIQTQNKEIAKKYDHVDFVCFRSRSDMVRYLLEEGLHSLFMTRAGARWVSPVETLDSAEGDRV